MQDLAPSPQALDVLEARVAAVEARVFGPRGPAAALAAGVVPSAKGAGPLAVAAAAAGAVASAGGDAPPAGAPQARAAAPHAHASATEALASAHALLQAATSGREKAAAVLHRRLLELDAYLSLATSGLAGSAGASTPAAAAAAARWPLVRREEPALREAADQLRRLAELRPALDPRPLAAAAELRPRLAAAAARADADREAALQIALQVAKLKEQQNAALDHVTQGLALLEAQVSRLEIAAMPRQPID